MKTIQANTLRLNKTTLVELTNQTILNVIGGSIPESNYPKESIRPSSVAGTTNIIPTS